MNMLGAIPALPVKNTELSIEFYCDKLGFALVHHEDGLAILRHNVVSIHLWEAGDESWRDRDNSSLVRSGSESFIAGTASCRIEVEGIEELYQHVKSLGILHPNGSLCNQWWGEQDFSVIDTDNNLITFFQKTQGNGKQKV